MLVACGTPGPDAVNDPIDYAKFFSRSHDSLIRVYDEAGNVIETHEFDTPRPWLISFSLSLARDGL